MEPIVFGGKFLGLGRVHLIHFFPTYICIQMTQQRRTQCHSLWVSLLVGDRSSRRGLMALPVSLLRALAAVLRVPRTRLGPAARQRVPRGWQTE